MSAVLVARLIRQLSLVKKWPGLAPGRLYATEDYFWSIPAEQLFSSDPPNRLTAGQLFDSAEFTRNALHGDGLVRYSCVWVADILRGVVDGVVTLTESAGAKSLALSTQE